MQRYCKSTLNPTWCTLRYIVQLSRSSSRKNAAWLDQSTNSQPCRCLNTDPKHEEADARRKRQDTIMNVFDRKAKRIQRDRAAVAENHQVFDYIKDEFGYRLADRICDIKRKFDVAVELGCGKGFASKHVYSDMVTRLYQCELSQKLLELSHSSPEVATYKVIADEEFFPFKTNSLDLVFSNLSFHWVNDLPGCFHQIYDALKNDAVFLGSMFGGDTLYQLRVALQLAELEREGGFAPHVSPFTDVRDLGNLLAQAGFTMLTIDIDEMTVNYPTMYEVMFDLKGMGENNCAWSRKTQLHRDTMIAAAAIYQDMYGNEKGVPATFQVINFIGWKPDPTQPQAAKRGSGEISLKDLDKINQLASQSEDHQTNQDFTSPKKE
ncbi:arginine-hydroxylase NDUFAF5, mitochondrial-like [Pomacea canaliculata]|uniref:arginine-hydroxylase NDUFAF5, mitochondrial-like n=1 Tax=Pomacea canaliculata TaxID=400727 RepID=UPI000D734408|nr:arginine-hydroxylase NDUFAF5, mitochondrial-like [Pomacea canaliculata]